VTRAPTVRASATRTRQSLGPSARSHQIDLDTIDISGTYWSITTDPSLQTGLTQYASALPWEVLRVCPARATSTELGVCEAVTAAMACKHKRSRRAFRGRTLEAPDDGTTGCHSFVSFSVVQWSRLPPCFVTKTVSLGRSPRGPFRGDRRCPSEPLAPGVSAEKGLPRRGVGRGRPLPFQRRFCSLGTRP
jgi:hypothetical protein